MTVNEGGLPNKSPSECHSEWSEESLRLGNEILRRFAPQNDSFEARPIDIVMITSGMLASYWRVEWGLWV